MRGAWSTLPRLLLFGLEFRCGVQSPFLPRINETESVRHRFVIIASMQIQAIFPVCSGVFLATYATTLMIV